MSTCIYYNYYNVTGCSKHGSYLSNVIYSLLYSILLLFIEEESCQEMSEKNKMKSKLTEKKAEWVVSDLTSEEKTSKDVDDLSVPTEGGHITLKVHHFIQMA